MPIGVGVSVDLCEGGRVNQSPAQLLQLLVDTAPTALYPFTQGADAQVLYDSMGAVNGTLGSSAGSDTNDPSYASGGLAFGGDDMVNLGDAFDSVIAGADKQFSWQIAFRVTAVGVFQMLLGKHGDSSHSEDQRQHYSAVLSNGRCTFAFYGEPSGNIVHGINGSTVLAPNTDYLLTVVYDGTQDGAALDRVKLYVGSTRETEALGTNEGAWPHDIVDTTARLAFGAVIGASSSVVAYPLTGRIYYASLYNRLLSAGDVSAYYALVRPLLASRGVSF